MGLFYEDVLSSTSILTVLSLLIILVLALQYIKSNNGLPPGPRGWPIVGSTFNMDVESHLTFDKWAKKYGDIFTVQLGLDNVIILNSIDVVKSAMKDQGDKFIDRPILPIFELGYTRLGGIVFENGHPWSERRRWASVFVRDFCLGKKGLGHRVNLENQVNIEAEYLCQELDKQVNSFVPEHFINNAVSNIICTASFGDRFEYSDPKFKDLTQGIRYLFNLSSFTSPVNVIPLLFYTPMYSKFRNKVSAIKLFIGEIIQQHEETFDSADIRDIIDAYIKETRKEDVDLELFSKDILWRTIFDLFTAATDTISSLMLFIIVYFLKYPDVQKRIQQEVDDVLGQEKKPTWGDRHSMPYLEATIMEVQRLSNAAPLFVRQNTEEVILNGYKIPASSTVISNIHGIQRHPNYWENPLEFNPERFLMEDQKTIKKHEAFIPFGLGRRVCLGDLMARMETFLFTANLVQRFTFRVPEGKLIPSPDDCGSGIILSPKEFEVNIIKR